MALKKPCFFQTFSPDTSTVSFTFSIVAAKIFGLTLRLFLTEALDNDMSLAFFKFGTGTALTAITNKKHP